MFLDPVPHYSEMTWQSFLSRVHVDIWLNTFWFWPAFVGIEFTIITNSMLLKDWERDAAFRLDKQPAWWPWISDLKYWTIILFPVTGDAIISDFCRIYRSYDIKPWPWGIVGGCNSRTGRSCPNLQKTGPSHLIPYLIFVNFSTPPHYWGL